MSIILKIEVLKMSENTRKVVMAVAKSKVHTYPACNLAVRYGLPVDHCRKLKLGGSVELAPAVAKAMEADQIIGIVKPSK